MKKRQYKKKITSKRIRRNEEVKEKIRKLVIEAEEMQKIPQNTEDIIAYWRGNADGLFEALCLINDGRW